jgi:hypothetical protein
VKVELHPHQKKAVDEMHNGCVLAGDVGVGKTITALSYALLKEPGRDIYVITTAKKRDSGDWQHEAAKLAVPVDKIIVDSWNNIKHYHKVHGALFIFDEQRLVGTGAWVKTFLDIARKNRWILLSATPGDTWLDYVPVFIANGFYKNVTEFRQQHVVYSRYSKFPKVERYLNPGLLQRRRKLVLVEMPMVRHTTRHIQTIECDYDKEVFDLVWKKRWNVYSDEPIKDAGELFRVGRKVVNSDPSRLGEVRRLLTRHPRLIVFYNFDYELEMLRTINHDLGFLDWKIAEWNGHKHEEVPDSDKWVYLVQYTAGSEGWNCITTNATCFFSATYSYKQYYQAQGRTDRMNTTYTDLFYYVLTSKSIVDKAVLRALRSKKDFNVRRFAW